MSHMLPPPNSIPDLHDEMPDDLPVAIVGAGPIGLAAAAHLASRDEPFILLEAGPSAATSIQEWAHVRLFTPWRYNVDPVAMNLLQQTKWAMPDPDAFPTGAELVDAYLEPLSHHPAIAPSIRYGHRVVAIARDTIGKLEEDREDHPFVLQVEPIDGSTIFIPAWAVIDASGCWSNPNPLGSNGLQIPGERALQEHIRYRVPDILGRERERYAGKRVLVAGSGHSALNALQDLTFLAQDDPATKPIWAIRRDTTKDALDACDDDHLTERTLLKRDVREMTRNGAIATLSGIRLTHLERTPEGIVAFAGDRALPPVDEIVAATGFRPDHGMERELRLDVQSVYESTYALAPLIDPDANACGTVPPHGVQQLAHPEPDFYIVGMKSYGRAPTFLMLTGYEQVRSVVCAIVGDKEALEVKLVLPEKGLCAACTAFLEEREDSVSTTCACGDEDGDFDAECCAADVDVDIDDVQPEAVLT